MLPQFPKHAIHTSKHENDLEEAPPKLNSPNCSFINIDSDIDSSEKMMSSFEQQAQETKNLPPEEVIIVGICYSLPFK